MTNLSPHPDYRCTDPERWVQPPGDHAPDDEVLAYLEHCETCTFHAVYEMDIPFDDLLREASRDVNVDPAAVRQIRRLSFVDRSPQVRHDVIRWSVALSALAVVLVVAAGWLALQNQAQPTHGVAEPMEEAAPDDLLGGDLVDGAGQRLWVTAWVIDDARHGRYTRSGIRYDKDALTAAIEDQPFGTHLRVINPVNGAEVIVTVIDRGAEDGELNLSSRAAAALGFDGTAELLIEVLAEQEVYGIGP